jgi:acetoin utilization deacetylase AcuC-like enzyme
VEDLHHRPGHPERPERIDAVLAGIDDLHLGDDLRILPPSVAERELLVPVHDGGYLDHLDAFCRTGGGDLDPDTYATAGSWAAALRVAGAGLAAVDALRREGDGVAFVAARPPGHHALADQAYGFCLVNNVAVAAAALRASGERVLVVDWDVHHGNGTQAIFWDDPEVLFVSTHQWPLFPGTGAAHEVGGAGAPGGTVNVPLPAGATGDVLLRALEEVALPVIERFAPTWVLVSAGFDAHRRDPLGQMALDAGDFAALARLVAGFAPGPGRLALFLEGGYDLSALRTSVAATLGALLGATDVGGGTTSGGPGAEMVAGAAALRADALRDDALRAAGSPGAAVSPGADASPGADEHGEVGP